MYLLAQSKIIEYINREPLARVALLTWLKEFPYRLQKHNMFLNQEGNPVEGNGGGSAQPDRGEYCITYNINYAAKAICITWVGSKKEYELKNALELDVLRSKHPGSKVTQVVLKVTPTANSKRQQKVKSSQTKNVDTALLADIHQNIESLKDDENSSVKQSFETEIAYKQGLTRLETIFNAQPESAEFNQLLNSLPLIKNYEQDHMMFPSLEVYEIIGHRMNVFEMLPADLSSVIGSEEDVNQFLAGKLHLKVKAIQRLFRLLGICLPVNY